MGYTQETIHMYECDRCGIVEEDRWSSQLPGDWTTNSSYTYCEDCTEQMRKEDEGLAGSELSTWMENNGLL